MPKQTSKGLKCSRVSDQISYESLLAKFKILSANQKNAQIKLNEMWKSTHISNYPVKTSSLVFADSRLKINFSFTRNISALHLSLNSLLC